MKQCIYISVCILIAGYGYGQRQLPAFESMPLFTEQYEPEVWIAFRSICKNAFFRIYRFQNMPVVAIVRPQYALPANVHTPAIQLHGNLMYNSGYRSFLDTPYHQQDLWQHTLQTYMDVTLAGQYPFRVYVTHRRSNSSYFLNATDISVQYRKSEYALPPEKGATAKTG